MADIKSVIKNRIYADNSPVSRIENALSDFARKPFSFVVFTLIAFFCLFISALSAGYNILTFNTEMQVTYYQFFLCDFSAGFCSRVIVGAVTLLFTDKVSIEQMEIIANSAVLVSFILMSCFAGYAIKKAFEKKAPLYVVFALVFCLNPLISQVNFVYLGTLDVYSLILFLLTVATYGTKLFYFTAPVFSFLGMTVHYHYLLTFFPAVLVLFIYDMFMSEKKNKIIASSCGFSVTALTGGGSFVYFFMFAKNHLKMTADEFYYLLVSRFDISPGRAKILENILDGNVLYREYFDYYIFGYYKDEYYYDSEIKFIDLLKNDRISRTPLSFYEDYLSLALPILIAFIAIWIVCAVKQKGKRRLPFIAAALITAALFPELFLSTDVMRWTSMTVTAQFILMFILCIKNEKTLDFVVGFYKLKNRTAEEQ